MDGITRNSSPSSSHKNEQTMTPKLSVSLIIVAVLIILFGAMDLGVEIYSIYHDGNFTEGLIFGAIAVFTGIGILRKKRFFYLVARIISFLLVLMYAGLTFILLFASESEHITFYQEFGFSLAFLLSALVITCWMFWVLIKSAPLFARKRK